LRRRCIDRALSLLGDGPPSSQRAEGQERLGQIFVDADQPEEAVSMFREALHGYSPLQHPVEHAHVLEELGDSLRDIGSPAAIEESITVYMQALDTFTPLAFPAEHAKIQTALADSHYTQYRREHRPEALDHSIAALEQAVQVEPREQEPENWAERNVTLGDHYVERAKRRQEDQSHAAVAFQQALKVYSPQRDLFV
jgi:tetratricopeptide (TPR) repeat protein